MDLILEITFMLLVLLGSLVVLSFALLLAQLSIDSVF
jgi:hypothetical protein